MQRTLWLAVVIPFSIGVTCAVAGGDESPGAANTTCSSPMDSILAVTLRPQQASNWCWAASGEMVMEYLENPLRNASRRTTGLIAPIVAVIRPQLLVIAQTGLTGKNMVSRFIKQRIPR